MNIRFFNGIETVNIESPDLLIEVVKKGQINKNSRVYDVEIGEYRSLDSIEAVRAMGLKEEYNEYLNLDVQRIITEDETTERQRRRFSIIVRVGIVLIIIGMTIRVIDVIDYIDSVNNSFLSSYQQGGAIGSYIGKKLYAVIALLAAWSWAKKKNKGETVIGISIFYCLSGIIGYVSN